MGFVRRIIQSFTRKSEPVVIRQEPAQTTTQTAKKEGKTAQALAASKSGSYGGQTLMTEATGLEEEANVSKTALGGSSIKKKKNYA